MDSVHPAAIALHNPKKETNEGWEFIPEPGRNKEAIDTRFHGSWFEFILAMDTGTVQHEPEMLLWRRIFCALVVAQVRRLSEYTRQDDASALLIRGQKRHGESENVMRRQILSSSVTYGQRFICARRKEKSVMCLKPQIKSGGTGSPRRFRVFVLFEK
jgi:hypothetical protein